MTAVEQELARHHPPTIYDIARLAGVSHTTVSRAVNGQDGIASITIEGIDAFVGQTFTTAHGVFTITGLSAPANGTATAITVSYSYQLTDNMLGHTGAGNAALTESFAVAVTDTDGSSASDTVEVRIVDDAPFARSDADTVTEDGALVADGNGRWPAVFIPYSDNGFDVKVTTSGGTQLYYYQSVPNSDPVEAGSASVAASELWATGHVMWRPVGGTLDGFVRLNGRTIGSSASGATERANSDTEDLFTHLWNGLANDQAAQGAVVTGLPSGVGNYCARISDVGKLTGSVTFELTVVHP